MKTSQKLQKKIADFLGYKVGIPERIRIGLGMRKAGFWIWSIDNKIGSVYTMKDCVNAENLFCYKGDIDIEIFPERKKRKRVKAHKGR